MKEPRHRRSRSAHKSKSSRAAAQQGDASAPRLVVGLQPVREAIGAHGNALGKVLIEAKDSPRLAALERFAGDQGVTEVRRLHRRELDRLCGGVAHQGVAAYAPPLALLEPQALLDREGLVAVALDGVQDPQNFGAVIRSAVGVVGAAVVWGEHSSAPLTPATFRASAGAVEHAQLCRVASLVAFLNQAVEHGVTVIALDSQAESELADCDLSGPTVVVVGSEHEGLQRGVRRACPSSARLIRTSGVASLNASVAAALALYQVALCRRRPAQSFAKD